MQQPLIPLLLGAAVEAGLDFRENDEWNPDLLARSQSFRQRSISAKEIGQPVRLDSDLHFHFSRSI